MGGWLVAVLVLAGLVTFLVAVSMVCTAVETAAACRATGRDVRRRPERATADDVRR